MGATRTSIAIGLGVLLLAAGAGTGAALYLSGDDPSTTPLTVSWGGDEGHPACTYQPKRRTVTAVVRVTGDAGDTSTVTVTVAAYADENTSRKVGSDTREISVDGAVDTEVDLTMRVRRPPHLDDDGVAACSLDADGAAID